MSLGAASLASLAEEEVLGDPREAGALLQREGVIYVFWQHDMDKTMSRKKSNHP